MRTIAECLNETFPPLQAIVIAFSGGSDSLALLVGLAHAGRLLYPVYVNHHIRPEEELSREIALNKANCEKLGLRLVVEDIDSRRLGELAKEVGTEQAARQLRYEILIGFAKEHQAVLATAHTADDQLETLLMRLLQGSSAIHLAIAPKVVFEGVAVYHPLLGFSHAQLGEYLRGEGFSWTEDSTNSRDDYLRNRIRHHLVPVVKELFPQALSSVSRTARSCSELSDYIGSLAAPVKAGSLSRSDFLSAPPCVRDEMVYRLLASDKRVRSSGIQRIREALEHEKGDWTIHAQSRIIVCNDGLVTIYDAPAEQGFCVSVAGLAPNTEYAFVENLSLCISEDTPSLDEKLLRFRPEDVAHGVLRSPLPGDSLPTKTGMVRVRDLILGWKIPEADRMKVPVLENETGVIAVFGRWCGGKDRMSVACKSLAPRGAIVYSIVERVPE